MARVICDLPNASDEIGGVKFHLLNDGRRISDEISDSDADYFVSIPGYELDEVERAPEPVAPAAPAPKLTKKQQEAAAAKVAKEAEDAKAAADKAAADQAAADAEAAKKDAGESAATGTDTGAAPDAGAGNPDEVF